MSISGMPRPNAGAPPLPVHEPWTAEGEGPLLRELVSKMMEKTDADGAAIVLRVGDSFFCRARAGNAPRLGVAVDPESGLSGKCLRASEVVLCADTESSAIVNVVACRAMRLRAALLVPIRRAERVEGVLEVFSSTPYLFDENDAAALSRIADEIAASLPTPASETSDEEATTDFCPAAAPAGCEAVSQVPTPEPAGGPDAASGDPSEPVTQPVGQPQVEVVASKARDITWPNAIFRLVEDPGYRKWRRVAYWSARLVRQGLSLTTLTIPLSYAVFFLIGPVIRPAAVEGTGVMSYMTGVVEPGMRFADYFFAFHPVVHGWNFMFLVMAVLILIIRGMALHTVFFWLRRVEDLTRPRKHYAYVPYLPHRTEYR